MRCKKFQELLGEKFLDKFELSSATVLTKNSRIQIIKVANTAIKSKTSIYVN